MVRMSQRGDVKLATLVCIAMLPLCTAASGQNCSNGVNPNQCTPIGTCDGPDVILGDINGVANYSAAGGLDAFALGDTACNIGNVWLNWFADTAQHPVFSQALYKLKTLPNGVSTYEQLGNSWLKHGFFTLSENLCCSDCQATNGAHLGVHCSGPYTAAGNGLQGSLSPKWQVNATTGAFTYPPANPPWSGTVARRLQVKIAELEPSSPTVRYFAAGMFVAPDDAAAGHQNNNQSYRAAIITNPGGTAAWSMSLSGTTQRTRQGIRAWADTFPSVQSVDLQIPGEGLFIVASNATDLGNGVYNYEYAVQNFNSDRSARAFSIPVPAGVLITNIGFHDVDYHDGDGPGNINYSGADWSVNMTNGQVSDGMPITWSTQTFAENQSASALRWDQLYNFRFDANVAPTLGAATLGMFKPVAGQPDSFATPGTGVLTPGVPPQTCPCDYNHTGGLNSQDFFDFLADFFGNVPAADYNDDDVVNSQDFFDFLACFFDPPQGC